MQGRRARAGEEGESRGGGGEQGEEEGYRKEWRKGYTENKDSEPSLLTNHLCNHAAALAHALLYQFLKAVQGHGCIAAIQLAVQAHTAGWHIQLKPFNHSTLKQSPSGSLPHLHISPLSAGGRAGEDVDAVRESRQEGS